MMIMNIKEFQTQVALVVKREGLSNKKHRTFSEQKSLEPSRKQRRFLLQSLISAQEAEFTHIRLPSHWKMREAN